MKAIWSKIDLTSQPTCPLCKTQATGPIVMKRWDRLPLRRCVKCALLFLDSVPSEAALARCYAPTYFSSCGAKLARFGPANDYHVLAADIDTGRINGYAEIIENLDLRGETVLEVGCATGALLQSLRKHDPAGLVGIDIAEEQIAWGREHYGLDLRCTTLERAGFASDDFDLIIMLDVIEHVLDPARLFAEAFRCVKPGGAIFLHMPNADSIAVAGHHWTYRFIGLEHVSYFSFETFQWLAKRYNLSLEKIWSEGDPAIVPYPRLYKSRIARLLHYPILALGNKFYLMATCDAPQHGFGKDWFVLARKSTSPAQVLQLAGM